MKQKSPNTFQAKDLDLITYLRFKGFEHTHTPIEDSDGTKWVAFHITNDLEKSVLAFCSGNYESRLLNELRKTRAFLLDSKSIKNEIGERKDEPSTHYSKIH